ncbi:hypothetical protein M440DRAFT_1121967 [Trichoderma longibrachiatum ATCC 18648]|uniref:Uncharacterized protein n=1 Tax=Trichoderma longibrachiatum ATCC 18648 TaxID=983965 RepID=A0A2T4CFI9_TRILO|nr:hypothetical protein M440DRAFT_1121967 [Trichoderma longibrachiatum ATCC 18648]
MEYNSALLAATYSLSYGRCISSNKGLIRLRDPSGVQVSSASEPSPASILTSWGSLLICSTHRPPFSRKINDYYSYDLPLSAEHRHSRSRTSELIRRRLCRSNYVFVVHKLVATCYPSALDYGLYGMTFTALLSWMRPEPAAALQVRLSYCRYRRDGRTRCATSS